MLRNPFIGFGCKGIIYVPDTFLFISEGLCIFFLIHLLSKLNLNLHKIRDFGNIPTSSGYLWKVSLICVNCYYTQKHFYFTSFQICNFSEVYAVFIGSSLFKFLHS